LSPLSGPSEDMKKRRYLSFLLLIMLSIGCNSRNDSDATTNGQAPSPDGSEIQRYSEKVVKDTLLLSMTTEILEVIKEEDLQGLAEYFHPEMGVRFSPYGYIDTVHHVHFSREEFIKQLEEGDSLLWGMYDGTGTDIYMSVDGYFDKFVYEVDFLNAEEFSVNEILGTGNSLINIDQVYPGADFTESYFSGFEEKYGGMDWRSLRLVFKADEEQLYLVGIVHDQWTI